MFNFIINVLNAIIKGLGAVFSLVFSLLPPSPFKILDNAVIKEYLPALNWFCPIEEILLIMELWLTAVGVYYIYMAVLRHVKAIE